MTKNIFTKVIQFFLYLPKNSIRKGFLRRPEMIQCKLLAPTELIKHYQSSIVIEIIRVILNLFGFFYEKVLQAQKVRNVKQATFAYVFFMCIESTKC